MEVIIRPTAEAAARLTAALVTDAIRAKPDLVLGLATGRTMERVYALLVEQHNAHSLSFARVTTFNLDEYIGIFLYKIRRYPGEEADILVSFFYLLVGTNFPKKYFCTNFAVIHHCSF